ncbi:MAG: hypothetical protein AAFZ74_06810 [Pseudomonadota bacterium]
MRKPGFILQPAKDLYAAIDGIDGDLRISSDARLNTLSMVSTDKPSPTQQSGSYGSFVGSLGWYKATLALETDAYTREDVDRGFLVPVWIASLLFCLIVHVSLFKYVSYYLF